MPTRRRWFSLGGGAARVDASVFDGGTIRLYSGAGADDAGDLLAQGSLPSRPFENAVDQIRAKRGTWSMTATKNGQARGLLISNVGTTINAWLTVTEAGGGGDVIIDNDDIQIGDAVAIVTLAWDTDAAPDPGSEEFDNQPSGYTLITDTPWDAVPERGVSTPEGWIEDSNGAADEITIITDATAPQPTGFTDDKYAKCRFLASLPGGSAPIYVYRPFASPAEEFPKLFIGLWLKHDTGWVNTPGGNSEVKFIWPAGDQVGGTQMYIGFQGADMELTIHQQGAVSRDVAPNLDVAAAQIEDRIGDWVKIEIDLRANTSDAAADGSLDVWIDDVHTHSYTNMQWQMQASRKWMSLAWNPTFGGGLTSPPADQYQSISHLRIAGHA